MPIVDIQAPIVTAAASDFITLRSAIGGLLRSLRVIQLPAAGTALAGFTYALYMSAKGTNYPVTPPGDVTLTPLAELYRITPDVVVPTGHDGHLEARVDLAIPWENKDGTRVAPQSYVYLRIVAPVAGLTFGVAIGFEDPTNI